MDYKLDTTYDPNSTFFSKKRTKVDSSPVHTSAEDTFLSAPSDNDSDHTKQRKKKRREHLAEDYLRHGYLPIMTASLKGPFEPGWENPWTRRPRSNIAVVIDLTNEVDEGPVPVSALKRSVKASKPKDAQPSMNHTRSGSQQMARIGPDTSRASHLQDKLATNYNATKAEQRFVDHEEQQQDYAEIAKEQMALKNSLLKEITRTEHRITELQSEFSLIDETNYSKAPAIAAELTHLFSRRKSMLKTLRKLSRPATRVLETAIVTSSDSESIPEDHLEANGGNQDQRRSGGHQATRSSVLHENNNISHSQGVGVNADLMPTPGDHHTFKPNASPHKDVGSKNQRSHIDVDIQRSAEGLQAARSGGDTGFQEQSPSIDAKKRKHKSKKKRHADLGDGHGERATKKPKTKVERTSAPGSPSAAPGQTLSSVRNVLPTSPENQLQQDHPALPSQATSQPPQQAPQPETPTRPCFSEIRPSSRDIAIAESMFLQSTRSLKSIADEVLAERAATQPAPTNPPHLIVGSNIPLASLPASLENGRKPSTQEILGWRKDYSWPDNILKAMWMVDRRIAERGEAKWRAARRAKGLPSESSGSEDERDIDDILPLEEFGVDKWSSPYGPPEEIGEEEMDELLEGMDSEVGKETETGTEGQDGQKARLDMGVEGDAVDEVGATLGWSGVKE